MVLLGNQLGDLFTVDGAIEGCTDYHFFYLLEGEREMTEDNTYVYIEELSLYNTYMNRHSNLTIDLYLQYNNIQFTARFHIMPSATYNI